ncbi:MAG: hypothetical protein L0Z62_13690 [Gemmataceae bacterium]|nr:hypothetical protein [Gemmataceae bacterium]
MGRWLTLCVAVLLFLVTALGCLGCGDESKDKDKNRDKDRAIPPTRPDELPKAT